eukprot:TRINITY_DN12150_c0_g12_i1.p1 TRINITY_DN12150_c0_g12~~TRINITY_DN12150_c0_g12_i1.p1  ORF type:complete len:206 (+),score=3.86 TRINITY_DN12150_c0_g12_i1:579-1196(+)
MCPPAYLFFVGHCAKAQLSWLGCTKYVTSLGLLSTSLKMSSPGRAITEDEAMVSLSFNLEMQPISHARLHRPIWQQTLPTIFEGVRALRMLPMTKTLRNVKSTCKPLKRAATVAGSTNSVQQPTLPFANFVAAAHKRNLELAEREQAAEPKLCIRLLQRSLWEQLQIVYFNTRKEDHETLANRLLTSDGCWQLNHSTGYASNFAS